MLQEDPVIFTSGDETWIRTGSCCRCGDCCKGNPFEHDDSEYCPLFTFINEQATCTDRNHPYYLSGCNVFPQHPSQIADKPRCSYTFKRGS